MSRRSLRIALVTALIVGAASGLAQASGSHDAVVGSEGELYTLVYGTFGELFDQAGSAEAANPVLALEIRRPGAATDRLLVADTGGNEVESSATLVYEESSRTLFVAWESRRAFHSRIRLAAYSNGSWAEPIDVSDTRFSLKSAPKMAVTRESYKFVDDHGADVLVHRTLLHVVWQEERAEGMVVVYAPLVLIDGAYTGAHAIVTLVDLVPVAAEDLLATPLDTLPLAPTLQAGSDDQSVVIGFVDPRTARLTSIEVSLLSGAISTVADEGRAHIIDLGSRYELGQQDELRAFADEVRGDLIDIGRHLDQRLLQMIADEIRVRVIELGTANGGEIGSIADAGRAHIIDLGARLQIRGLRPVGPGATGVLDLSAESGASIVLRFDVVASLGLPAMGADPILLVSADGARALVAWEVEDRLEYRESKSGTWSDVASLPLTELGRDLAYEILEQRVGGR